MYIEIVQLSGKKYFWVLRDSQQVYAISTLIGEMQEVSEQVEQISMAHNWSIIVSERK